MAVDSPELKVAAASVAILVGTLYLWKHKLPGEAFHAYCVEHELVPFNEYFSTAASACSRRQTTAGLYSLVPAGGKLWQPYSADDLGLLTLVTTHDGARYAGALGAWYELPWGLRSLAAGADLFGDVVRIVLALGGAALVGGLAMGVMNVLKKAVKAATTLVGAVAALVMMEKYADTSRAASYVSLGLCAVFYVANGRKKRAAAAAAKRRQKLLAKRDADYLAGLEQTPPPSPPPPETPGKAASTTSRSVTPEVAGK